MKKMSKAEQLEKLRQERIASFKDWILLNERLLLVKVEKMIDNGHELSLDKIKQLRGELVVPAQYRKLVLTQEQMDELEDL